MQMNNKVQKNVFGEPLESCSNDPLTGWFRDGCCNTDKNDRGTHTVCATWYAKAIEEDSACSIFLKKTNIKTLKLIPLEKLKKFAIDLS